MKPIPFESDSELQLPQEVQLERAIRVMERELTKVERQVVEDYFLNGIRIPELAIRYGVQRSTVSRNLRRAVKRLQRYLRY